LNHAKPHIDLPVIYEDDHFAAVNKPAGFVVHGKGVSIRAALPFCLTPPRKGTWAVIRRPIGVHRLDKPTSGILLCAKTRPAMVELARQFSHRVVKKTYLAIINGIPLESTETSISSRQAFEMGVDVDPNNSATWQVIDHPLDGKSSVTVWRKLRRVESLKATDGNLTLVELKPKTGRFHQLRRHMVHR
jgi:tRNA pseudouridine65 synthase/23S rRNA pseudouridine1911/1915/1917 synthase